jgi:hypothetical protein
VVLPLRSILQAFEGIMEVLGTAGDAQLGGNDFDARLADWLLAQAAAAQQHGQQPRQEEQQGQQQRQEGPPSRQWAMQAAEAAKVALSSGDSVEVALPGGGPPLVLTRQQFEEVTADLFQLMANVLEALGEALFIEWAVKPSDAVPGRAPQQRSAACESGGESGGESDDGGGLRDRWAPPPRRITQVALVGQVTRLPSVRSFVERITGGLAGWPGVSLREAVACASPEGSPPPSCLALPPCRSLSCAVAPVQPPATHPTLLQAWLLEWVWIQQRRWRWAPPSTRACCWGRWGGWSSWMVPTPSSCTTEPPASPAGSPDAQPQQLAAAAAVQRLEHRLHSWVHSWAYTLTTVKTLDVRCLQQQTI